MQAYVEVLREDYGTWQLQGVKRLRRWLTTEAGASVELPENLRERPGPEVYARAFGRAGGG